MPYLQYQRTHSRMTATGKRRRLNKDIRAAPWRTAPRYSAKVNATVPYYLWAMVLSAVGCPFRMIHVEIGIPIGRCGSDRLTKAQHWGSQRKVTFASPNDLHEGGVT